MSEEPLYPLQEITIQMGTHDYTAADPLDHTARQLITDLGIDPNT